ncbi:MAG: hypothetical protein JJ882_11545 [Balneola sp.]|nr:hypothetical protein [Balneola sp.]MBO6871245.1 hypothetical protein [Balneola sp.]
MYRTLFFLIFLIPHISFAQDRVTSHPGSSNMQNILFILQMDSKQIGEKDVVINSEELQLHPLSGGDSLLVSFTGDSLLYSIDPERIDAIVVIKNKEEISHYTKKEVEGLVIIKFKDEKDFLSMISKQ